MPVQFSCRFRLFWLSTRQRLFQCGQRQHSRQLQRVKHLLRLLQPVSAFPSHFSSSGALTCMGSDLNATIACVGFNNGAAALYSSARCPCNPAAGLTDAVFYVTIPPAAPFASYNVMLHAQKHHASAMQSSHCRNDRPYSPLQDAQGSSWTRSRSALAVQPAMSIRLSVKLLKVDLHLLLQTCCGFYLWPTMAVTPSPVFYKHAAAAGSAHGDGESQ